MKIKNALLAALAAVCLLETQVQAGCYATGSYVCNQGESGTQSCGWHWYVTTGYVDRAAPTGESAGYDNIGYFNTTCDRYWDYYDCYGIHVGGLLLSALFVILGIITPIIVTHADEFGVNGQISCSLLLSLIHI